MTVTTLKAWIDTYGDDKAYLVPTLPTAPTQAYRQPACRVLRLDGPRVTVLVAGVEIETDIRNVKRTRPDSGSGRHRAYKAPALPDGFEQHGMEFA
jgi:hypothetical protein